MWPLNLWNFALNQFYQVGSGANRASVFYCYSTLTERHKTNDDIITIKAISPKFFGFIERQGGLLWREASYWKHEAEQNKSTLSYINTHTASYYRDISSFHSLKRLWLLYHYVRMNMVAASNKTSKIICSVITALKDFYIDICQWIKKRIKYFILIYATIRVLLPPGNMIVSNKDLSISGSS